MLAALGKSHEFKMHFRGAINNGLSEDLQEVLIQIAICYGIPAGVEAFRIARRCLEKWKSIPRLWIWSVMTPINMDLWAWTDGAYGGEYCHKRFPLNCL